MFQIELIIFQQYRFYAN